MKLAIIDFNRTIFDPDTGDVVDGARELLEMFKGNGIPCVLVSKEEDGRSDTIERLDLAKYFKQQVFVSGDKTPGLFAKILQDHDVAGADCCVVGDHLHQEIRAGNVVGAYTVHLKRGKFATLPPLTKDDVPNVTVEHLEHARVILAHI
jgi:predicted HAD superfamily phosphohydrolase YqeG